MPWHDSGAPLRALPGAPAGSDSGRAARSRVTRMRRCVLIGLVSVVAVSVAINAQRGADDGLAQVDHLVYATPVLDLGVKTIEGRLGVRATAGGQHPGLGTRNALI